MNAQQQAKLLSDIRDLYLLISTLATPAAADLDSIRQHVTNIDLDVRTIRQRLTALEIKK